ncbi:lytic transglycosylase domain-containing protein [Shimia thalassica]|uniref:lytic transglycosylase domain-containing protein n=1 Tax=Shimia thalassica TaxID=1715693 RepID=UPI0027365571|nr:lytic transglycosylase domain-containing protein [Shimia thalassica]MDP2495730.1 lytic transglycosylase domain-containing protein [Shimia thalassica]
MFRVWLAVLLAFISISTSVAQATPVSDAMGDVRSKDWAGAAREVKGESQVAQDIVEWHRLRAGEGSPAEVLSFLKRRPDWPGLAYLRKQSEPAFVDATRKQIAEFYLYGNAQTAQGVLTQARELERQGKKSDAQDLVVRAWREMEVGPKSHQQFLDRYGKLLKKHHVARMDMVLWKNWKTNTSRMKPLVNDGWQKLADARLGLRAQVKNVDVLIEAVPQSLSNDPGMAYERFVWRARKGRDASAIELLLERSRADTLGQAKDWSRRRRDLARKQMRAGNYKTAYAIASTHRLSPEDGYAYADNEWISGYVALRFLNKPGVAVKHFKRFETSVATPISLGRAGYWIGRSYEAMADSAKAEEAYRMGGAYQTSFYGLLSAEKAKMELSPALQGNEAFPSWRKAPFVSSSVHHAALLLLQAGELSLAERFWVHLSETQDRTALGQMGTMVQDLGAPHIAVMLGKKMVRNGVVLPGPYYPLHPMVNGKLAVSTEMALAIARRESEFDPVVVSHAGARGLMQVMPGTAKLVANRLDLPYSESWLTARPDYNITLGAEYLAGLAEQFDGNVIMVSAGYNAGPRRPERWMKERGDPRRRGGMDIVDWIEHIPFNETRNYVMRVSESLPIYRARLGRDPLPVPFSKELVGSTIKVTR